jgi:DNA polymerase-3 subunit alpha
LTEFCHTHTHCEYSLLDGFTKVQDLVTIAADLGQTAICKTDHGSHGGAFKFWQAGKEHGIKTIEGVEAYVTPDLEVKEKDSPTWHLILLAQNQTGLRNLFALSGQAWMNGFYRKPRTDLKLLQQYSEGIIATSSCMAGEVCRSIENGRIDEAVEALMRYKNIFSENFYVELQPGNEAGLNQTLAQLATDCGIKPIVGVDSHYDHCESKGNEELLLLMQQVTGMKQSDKDFAKAMADEASRETTLINRLNKLWPNRGLRFDHHDLYLMGRDEVVERMNAQGFDGNALADTTLEVAEKCEQVEFKTGVAYLPKIKSGIDSAKYLKALVKEGLEAKGLFNYEDYRERAKEELAIFEEKNFADYFLIVWDIFREARERGILTGPGRGSAAGSLVCYALDITKIDPIATGMLFARFINVERNDLPDIDMDFEHTRRDEMKDYVRAKYGEALSLSTYSEFKAKGLVRSIARVLAIDLGEVDKACKQFDSLKELEESKADGVAAFRSRYPEVVAIARDLEGHISNSGMHAAGFVVADRPMSEIVPIETRTDPADKKSRIPVSAFDMGDSEKVGLVKMDFLGLSNLTVIGDCIKLIKERHDISIDWEHLPLDDANVLADLGNGNTCGVFQMESSPYRKLLQEMGVDSFQDLVASNALVRPGAYLTVAKDYINRKRGKKEVIYPHPSVEEELRHTYGVYIYQEQVMQLAVKLGGFSWAKADKLRKIIGKKLDVAEFAPYYNSWMENASQLIGEKAAKKMWQDFEKHAGYSFNYSHAYCYTYIGWCTAWLKYYYPIEYMYSILRNEKNDMQKMTYLLECQRLGIDILPPDIHLSDAKTKIDGNSLRFGLEDIKGVGYAAIDEILQKRNFISFGDFRERCTQRAVNAKVVDALVAVGALDGLEGAPTVENPQENYLEYLNYHVESNDIPQIKELNITDCGDLTELEEQGEQFFLIKGIVKAIKRTPAYVRIEIEDTSGSTTVFGDMSNALETGDSCVALIGDKSMLGYCKTKGLKLRTESDTLTDFERFLFGDIFRGTEELHSYGIGTFSSPKALAVPLQVKEVTTKKGQQMAFAYLYDGNAIIKFTIFPAMWVELQKLLFNYVPVCVKPATLDDGGYTLWKNSVANAQEILDSKKERMKEIINT